MLWRGWQSNPLVRVPDEDADVYWTWAAEIAAGHLVGTAPFFSAPLFPYLLGLLRATGGGLLALFCIQIAVHVATVLLIGILARRRYDAATGVIAAALFVLLTEPALSTTRVLNGTIQLALVSLLWLTMLPRDFAFTPWRWAAIGVLLGLNTLANPPMIVAVPIVTSWALAVSGRWPMRISAAALTLTCALITILPATIHNYLASDELIPVSAQAGVTFRHGNAPGADGTYTAIAGVATQRDIQNLDARRLFIEAGGDGSWSGTSSYFFRQGLAYWAEDPARALGLAARKFWWFLTGRNYGDIYLPRLEMQTSVAPLLWLAPLPVAWLTLPALLVLVRNLRNPVRNIPEWLLLGMPLLVVTVFWFSPRYRLPALPVLVILSAYALRIAATPRRHDPWNWACRAALVAGMLTGPLNQWLAFDPMSPHAPRLHERLGRAYAREGRHEQAAEQYRRALELDPTSPIARSGLGQALAGLGRSDDALTLLHQAVAADPRNPQLRTNLGIALARAGRIPEAMEQLRAVVAAHPDQWQFRNNLANVLTAAGRDAEAVEHYRAALATNPTYVSAHYNLARTLARLGDPAAAIDHLRTALRYDPHLAAAHHELALLLVEQGQYDDGLRAAREAHRLSPAEVDFTNTLAWYLAVLPDRSSDERREAVSLARRADAATNHANPTLLDTLAAALAGVGRFHEAVSVAETALQLAENKGLTGLRTAIEARVNLYRAGRRYFHSVPEKSDSSLPSTP